MLIIFRVQKEWIFKVWSCKEPSRDNTDWSNRFDLLQHLHWASFSFYWSSAVQIFSFFSLCVWKNTLENGIQSLCIILLQWIRIAESISSSLVKYENLLNLLWYAVFNVNQPHFYWSFFILIWGNYTKRNEMICYLFYLIVRILIRFPNETIVMLIYTYLESFIKN